MTSAEPDPAGLDPTHILTICAEFDGDAGVQAVRTPDGVRVAMPTRRAAWEATGALGRVGYTAALAGDSRAPQGRDGHRMERRSTGLTADRAALGHAPARRQPVSHRHGSSSPLRRTTRQGGHARGGREHPRREPGAVARLGGCAGRDLHAVPARRAACRHGDRHPGTRGGLLRAGRQRPHRPAPARRRTRRSPCSVRCATR